MDRIVMHAAQLTFVASDLRERGQLEQAFTLYELARDLYRQGGDLYGAMRASQSAEATERQILAISDN